MNQIDIICKEDSTYENIIPAETLNKNSVYLYP